MKFRTRMASDRDAKFPNRVRHHDVRLTVEAGLIAPVISAHRAAIASLDRRPEHAGKHRPNALGANAGSTNKKACAVRSRRHGRQNSEEYRGAASSKGQSIT
ncbi:hypothetical protein [Burkholderia lata]|uniref:Uncharacterized protein n=1 Tax=Burkholderia lata (strain ATCC 17760 / DSM 23089 / LMG 22485 / NCIMB 9086 / R18194 / 383) TaxID=482957 RepID=Q39M70_BURL3|nr:hypothetical protein [Burkholderia lata]ABB06446.1 hypothetical protein Bcep18194_C7402 [Burkholderia lata]